MEKQVFDLKEQEFIELHNLLKHLNLVNSGGEAKIRIRAEEVEVDGEIETRKRKKLRTGSVVIFDNHTITIK